MTALEMIGLFAIGYMLSDMWDIREDERERKAKKKAKAAHTRHREVASGMGGGESRPVDG